MSVFSTSVARRDGKFFAKPVDRRNAPGYYEVIAQPMDFSTIRKKLRSEAYTKPSEYVRDVQQVGAAGPLSLPSQGGS